MIVLRGEMQEPRKVAVAGGQAVVYSRGAPDRDGPNEDGAVLLEAGAAGALLAVADGMGGGPEGDTAARLVLTHLQEAMQAVAADTVAGNLRSAVLDAAEAANRAICSLAVGAATTLAAVELFHDRVRPYHAGDSSVLVVGQRGRLKYQTVAHSPVGYAVEAGLLSGADALAHEDRHLVSNMLGSIDMRMEVASPLPLAPRDTLLLGTDGLFDNFTVAEMIQRVRKGPLLAAARRLAADCRERMAGSRPGPSKPDDLTFILYRRRAPGGP